MINLTPADIHFFSSNADSLSKSILLTLKSKMQFISTPIYSFTTQNGFRGFEFVPSATSTLVELFSPKDEQYEVLISGATPLETDAVLQSFKELGN